MSARKVTSIGIMIAVVGLIGLEAWTLVNTEQDDTISEIINSQSKRRLYIPFLFGALMGHWFWPLKSK